MKKYPKPNRQDIGMYIALILGAVGIAVVAFKIYNP